MAISSDNSQFEGILSTKKEYCSSVAKTQSRRMKMRGDDRDFRKLFRKSPPFFSDSDSDFYEKLQRPRLAFISRPSPILVLSNGIFFILSEFIHLLFLSKSETLVSLVKGICFPLGRKVQRKRGLRSRMRESSC